MTPNKVDAYVTTLQEIAKQKNLLKISCGTLFNAFLQKHPHLDALERRHNFAQALQQWEQTGQCRLPKNRKHWQHDANPPLPSWVQITRSKSADSISSAIAKARGRVWTPRMQFMANRRNLPDLNTAIALDNYIRQHSIESLPWVPAKERSVEIFGHGGEKKLETLAARTGWFREEGLTLATFHSFRVPRQPLHKDYPNAHPGGIIISENEAGYHSFCRAASAGAGFQCIVFGDGSEVARVSEFLAEKARNLALNEIFYLGDVDRNGLSIPTNLAGDMFKHFGIKLSPWTPAYIQMLKCYRTGQNLKCEKKEPEKIISSGPPWLPPDLDLATSQILENKEHLAQESIGWSFLSDYWELDPFFEEEQLRSQDMPECHLDNDTSGNAIMTS